MRFKKAKKYRFFVKIHHIIFLLFFTFYSLGVFSATYLRYDKDMEDAKKVSEIFRETKSLSTVNLTDNLRYKTFIWAIDTGDILLVKTLLANGAVADINKLSSTVDPLTPLMYAFYNNYPDIARLLIKTGADVNKVGKHCVNIGDFPYGDETHLICAAKKGGEFVELMLDNGAEVNYQDSCGMTALMWASYEHMPLEVESLFKKGVGIDVNRVDKRGKTALMWACRYSCYLCVEQLLKNGAKVNLQDENGETALMWTVAGAYENRKAGIIKTLLQSGADPTIKNIHGKTAIDHAKWWGCNECLSILEKRNNKEL